MSKKTQSPLIAYKGFDANLRCKGFQFEVGKSYTHKGAVKACSSGFHACENPLDVWSYYDLGGDNQFCRVQLSGALDRHEGDSKVAAKTIYVETKVTLGEMIRAGVKYEIDVVLADAKGSDSARNASSGGYARNASSGDYATNASSGGYARNASSGGYARNASSGDSATNASSGDYATNASSGDYARNAATGKGSTIAAAGLCSRARGCAGTAIALPYKDNAGQIRFACGVVGEDGIPADTWLIARDGKLVVAQ